MQFLYSTTSVINRYDAFIVDLWGVVHDGGSLYDGVEHVLRGIAEQGKPLIFLSNAPRRAHRSAVNLKRLGIGRGLYTELITSGETCIAYIEAHHAQQQAYFLGPEYERDMVADTSIRLTPNLADAEYILCIGHEYDNQPMDALQELLEEARQHNVPLFCANPDKLIITRDGWVCRCAGEIAEHYERMGGQVRYFGKPYHAVYEKALSLLAPLEKPNILVIGDNPETDIAGAIEQGLDSLLLTQGVLSHDVRGMGADEVLAYVETLGVTPTYVAESLILSSS